MKNDSSLPNQTIKKHPQLWIVVSLVIIIAMIFLWWWINDGGETGFKENNSITYTIQ